VADPIGGGARRKSVWGHKKKPRGRGEIKCTEGPEKGQCFSEKSRQLKNSKQIKSPEKNQVKFQCASHFVSRGVEKDAQLDMHGRVVCKLQVCTAPYAKGNKPVFKTGVLLKPPKKLARDRAGVIKKKKPVGKNRTRRAKPVENQKETSANKGELIHLGLQGWETEKN